MHHVYLLTGTLSTMFTYLLTCTHSTPRRTRSLTKKLAESQQDLRVLASTRPRSRSLSEHSYSPPHPHSLPSFILQPPPLSPSPTSRPSQFCPPPSTTTTSCYPRYPLYTWAEVMVQLMLWTDAEAMMGAAPVLRVSPYCTLSQFQPQKLGQRRPLHFQWLKSVTDNPPSTSHSSVKSPFSLAQ